MRYHEHEISCDLAGYDLYLGGPVLRGPVHLTKQQFTGEQMISGTAAAFNTTIFTFLIFGWIPHYFQPDLDKFRQNWEAGTDFFGRIFPIFFQICLKYFSVFLRKFWDFLENIPGF